MNTWFNKEKPFEHTQWVVLLVIALLLPLGDEDISGKSTSPFIDVLADHPSVEAISSLKEDGVLQGYQDGTFRPEENINRAEFLTVVIQGDSKDVRGGNCFLDVHDEWFAPFVCYAKTVQIVTGFSDGYFRPGSSIAFSAAAKILVVHAGLSVEARPIWYEPYVEKLRDAGAIPHTITRMDQNVSRAELADMVYQFRKYRSTPIKESAAEERSLQPSSQHVDEFTRPSSRILRQAAEWISPTSQMEILPREQSSSSESSSVIIPLFSSRTQYEPSEESTLSPAKRSDKERLAALPPCDSQQFSVSPVDLSAISEIYPLGNTAPPGHTLPTEHMYIHLYNDGGTRDHLVPLRAPGDITILSIAHANGEEDYSMHFALCRDVFGYFGHIKRLSDDMKDILHEVECELWTHNPGNLCSKNIFATIPAGTFLGEVGGTQGNFDFGAYDYRTMLSYTNPSRFGETNATGFARPRSHHIVCPLDLYASSKRKKIMQKIDRQAPPRCGKVMQDVPGTLFGNWYHEDEGLAQKWSSNLAFVQENRDPTLYTISIGGIVTQPSTWTFHPLSSGTHNRYFGDVTADGTIYCYSSDERTGKILVQLMDDNAVRIEHQEGICSDLEDFQDLQRYER